MLRSTSTWGQLLWALHAYPLCGYHTQSQHLPILLHLRQQWYLNLPALLSNSELSHHHYSPYHQTSHRRSRLLYMYTVCTHSAPTHMTLLYLLYINTCHTLNLRRMPLSDAAVVALLPEGVWMFIFGSLQSFHHSLLQSCQTSSWKWANFLSTFLWVFIVDGSQ